MNKYQRLHIEAFTRAQAVLVLHKPVNELGELMCVGCGDEWVHECGVRQPWPCETVRLLTGLEA